MRLKIIATFVLIFGLVYPVAIFAASPNAGAKCSKAGLTQISSGKKYTCVKSGNNLVWNKGVPTPTPIPTRSPILSPKPTPKVELSIYKESAKRSTSSACKVQDARMVKTQPNNVGFPLSPDLVPANGVAKMAFIPIDFSDAPGTEAGLLRFEEQEKAMADWYEFFSGGKLKFQVVTAHKWFRAPRPSTEYKSGKSSPHTMNPFIETWDKYAQEFIDATGSQFNWSDINAFTVFFPELQNTELDNGMLGRGQTLNTPQGTKPMYYWASGTFHFREAASLGSKAPYYWATLWIHELLHSQGTSLHAPGNGFSTGVGSNQGGYSWALDAWEIFKFGWFSEDQVYCLESNDISDTLIKLDPLEIKSSGNKIAIIPIDITRALIVESRRPVNYSKAWDLTDSGILVYILDTRFDNDRSMESSGLDNGNDPKYTKWSYYLIADKKLYPKFTDYLTFYKSFIIKTGETVSYAGVQIKLLASGEYDVVKVSKA